MVFFVLFCRAMLYIKVQELESGHGYIARAFGFHPPKKEDVEHIIRKIDDKLKKSNS